jgi:hypothetical protein
VAAGDFNGDGNLDLVVADAGTQFSGNSAVSVLLGNGDGSFQGPIVDGAGWRPFAFGVGDFNDDGRLDVVVGGGSGMHLLLGNGDGSFQVQTIPYALEPSDIVVGDFNGDGQLDIAAAGVSVLLGNGDGTFQAPRLYFGGGRNLSLAVGDFNRDGRLDLAVDSGGGVNVLLGNGDGTFQDSINSFGAGSGPVAIGVADFTGDGFADLVTANFDSNDVTLLVNAADWPADPRNGVGSVPALRSTAGELGAAWEASHVPVTPTPMAETAVPMKAWAPPAETGAEPCLASGIRRKGDQATPGQLRHASPAGSGAAEDWQQADGWVAEGSFSTPGTINP